MDEESLKLEGQKRMLSWLFTKKVPHLPTPDERKPYPAKTANYISQAFFWWLHPVMRTGYSRTLKPEDLFTLPDDIKVERMAAIFYSHFESGLSAAQAKHISLKCQGRGETPETSTVSHQEDLGDFLLPRKVTLYALAKTFKWQYFFSCVCLGSANVATTLNPLLTKRLIQFVENKAFGVHTNIGEGVGYAIGASILVVVIGVLMNHYFYRAMLTGAQTKAVLTKALLTKSFSLNSRSKHKYTSGKITTMMGADVSRIDFALGFQPFIFVFPIPFGVAIAILIVNIGVAALVGIGIMITFMIAVTFAIGKLFATRKLANKFTDSRVNYMKEALANLKVIKFYAWEPPYQANISDIRRQEMKLIFKMQILRNIVTAFAMSITLISSMVTFLTLYKINNGKRSPANIFSSISLFNVLSQQVILLPLALSTGSDALLGIGRIGEYLGSNDIDTEAVRTDATASKLVSMQEENVAIEVENASFEWENFDLDEEEKAELEAENTTSDDKSLTTKNDLKSQLSKANEKSVDNQTSLSSDNTLEFEFPGLQNIDLNIKKGEFIVITGLIGSGKSSLLNALSGFMNRTSGTVSVNGSLLLCGQPWIQNATVKDNIIFGLEYDEKRYKDVVYSCSLESDLDLLPGGDETEVGERGITLSGGQKARINLARAVYANKEIILMDDVLSAVDARVGKHIMNNCLMGMLKDTTRILATHQLSLIGSADRIIFLNGDGSITAGTFEELQLNAGFANLMAFNSKNKEEEEEEEVIEAAEDEDVAEYERELIHRQVSRKLKIPDTEAERIAFNANNTEDGKLIMDEEKAVNSIKMKVYFDYFKAGTGPFGPWLIAPVFLMCMCFATFCQIFTNTWLSFWTELKFGERTSGFYIGLYIMFTFLSLIFLATEFVILVYLTNTASVTLNVIATDKVLHTPMSFMDTTPMGRILNRFTKDTDALDNEIGDQMRFFLYTLCNIIGVLILCVIYLPWFAIAIPFLGYLFVAIADYYQASAREIKRLEAVERSLVYNNFNETLNGMPTIKAYGQLERFIAINDTCINNMNEAYYITVANQRWLAIHMDMVAACFAFLIAILCVTGVFLISPASVGLLLSYVFQIASQLSLLIRTFTQVENEMNSAERVTEYAYKLPVEAPYVITETTPHESWPSRGEIEFKDVSMAYRPGLPMVLKKVNFDVKQAEKIGICGRTGAGKSSIMTALYRLSELEGGKITIDDLDISTLGLKHLRMKLSIIPQDPVLFKGSIRKNLDPFNESSDEKLWDSLRRTGLIEASRLEIVKKQVKVEATETVSGELLHKFHLNQMVEDEGTNFSLGERQLIAFARALVRDSRILILDEATSSVDYETDSKIQETIVKEFSHCTILCIAHRLKTIINYDRILVMDKGEVAEFDTPKKLFEQKDSIFQQMCQKSNITEEDFQGLESF